MKRVGIAILVIGLVITLITGFSYVTKEKVVDIGELEISTNKRHNLNWSPLVGVGVMALGVVLILVGPKKV